MEQELMFREGEGDVIYMRNTVDIKWPSNRVNYSNKTIYVVCLSV
jgi:hypothetical protein